MIHYVHCCREECTHYCGRKSSIHKALGRPIDLSILANPEPLKCESDRDENLKRYTLYLARAYVRRTDTFRRSSLRFLRMRFLRMRFLVVFVILRLAIARSSLMHGTTSGLKNTDLDKLLYAVRLLLRKL